ncbi:MAG: ABC transporter permease [Gammaproteobacteria bacterium]|nr:ABC transporter permease [Gammaproteobacteria bacterium]MBA3731574.1 ABC transporter permease [Gammaproteobacteria bacterium]
MTPMHALRGMQALGSREVTKFWHQKGRLISALVRPALWLIVFAAGFQHMSGVAVVPPYDAQVEYQVYIAPGLLGMVLLFNSMQSSLSMVYDREMGLMRLLLTAPLPRWYLLLCKLMAGTLLSVLQAYAFLLLCVLFDVDIPMIGWLYALPALVLGGMMLGSLGLLLSVHIKQLENFAGTMNFVIFPMFFISSALYPLRKLDASGAEIIYTLARFNPFTHTIELIRFALYGQLNAISLAVVVGSGIVFFVLSVYGYDPQRGMASRAPTPA